MLPITKILVTLDGSINATAILSSVVALSKMLGAEMILLSCLETEGTYRSGKERQNKLLMQQRDYLLRKTQYIRNFGVKVSMHVITGVPSQEIIRFAKDSECDLIAMATRGKSAIVRGLVGSVAFDVIANKEIPTLTVSPHVTKEFTGSGGGPRSIAVAIDGSKESEACIPVAFSLASKADAELNLITVIHPEIANAGMFDGQYLGIYEEVLRNTQEYLEGVRSSAIKKNIPKAKINIPIGSPVKSIIDGLDLHGSEMVVLSTKTQSEVNGIVFGSTAEGIIRLSHRPVLTIPFK
jgi:nucleotide-binding universal stress UspA family protein